MPKNKTVTIVVYSPPNPPLIVPRVVGADIKNANEMLNAMGFRVIVEGDSKSAGSVVSVQKPGAGQYLTVGSEIRLLAEKKTVDADEASFNN
ncbi:MAG: PASTA domain-containing protein [Bdellovibrionales bacterium]|nr:PASTA domain-containing protein [Bdellovibrionales bacterium]